MKKKVVFLPYDFDTAIGINNEGSLVFSYDLEDIDHTESGADIFNGQQSVLWKNLREMFGEELKTMYQKLRSSGALSYEKVERMFEEHQAKWPEAVFNEDAWFKYLAPLEEKGSAAYLAMLQGSKAEQRKWWLYNRFRYIDSKYNAGDSLTDVITLRGYAKDDITVTPYADVYATIRYGSYLVQTRAARNRPYTLTCPLDNVNDTEIYIYSASQLADVGDLSGLKVGYAEFVYGTKLQSLKLGDADPAYDNGNLQTLYLGSNRLLKTLDVRNCSGLGTGDQKTVDLSGCTGLEEAYFDGTGIAGVTLPNGGVLRILHLPGTITSLEIMNQTAITDFSCPDLSNISTLRLENVPQAIDTMEIVKHLKPGSRVRLFHFNWELEDTDGVEEMLETLDSMRGLDQKGNNVDRAQLYGTIHVPFATGAFLASCSERYPDITFIADHVTATISYYNRSALISQEVVVDGADPVDVPVPAMDDAQYTYTFAGWSMSDNDVAVADILKNVRMDISVHAAYDKVIKTYTVRFMNGTTAVKTFADVPYGTTVDYSAEPAYFDTTEDPDDWTFLGWKPDAAAVPITGNTDCEAQWKYTGELSVSYLRGRLKSFVDTEALPDLEYKGYDGKEFTGQSNLTNVELEKVTTIRQAQFSGMNRLKTARFPNALIIERDAFKNCIQLESLYTPKVIQIGGDAFRDTRALKELVYPGLTSIDNTYIWTSNTGLTHVYLPKLVGPFSTTFQSCSSMITLDLPCASSPLRGNTLWNCPKLEIIRLGGDITNQEIEMFGYGNYPSGLKLVFDGTKQIPTGLETIFAKMDATVYVPRALLSTLDDMEAYADYTDRFFAVEDHPEIETELQKWRY